MTKDKIELTTKQLATRWSMTAQALRAWRMKGIGPSPWNKRGKNVTYDLSVIERYESDNRITPVSN